MGRVRTHDEVSKSLIILVPWPRPMGASASFVGSFFSYTGQGLLLKFVNMLFSLCRFIYTGSVEVTNELAQDLLRAADQYLLEGLKRLCEYTIAQVCNS